MNRSQRSNKSIRRAAIRYQNGRAAGGGDVPPMAVAIAAVLNKKDPGHDTNTRSSRSDGEDR